MCKDTFSVCILHNQKRDFLPDKIHYQQFDSLGRVVRVLVDNDAKDTTGVAGVDNDGDAVKGIESIISYERDIYGNVTETRNNLNAQGEVEEKVYTVRDAHGRETAKYWDLDNNVNTGTGNANEDPAIRTTDGRTLQGIERYETYAYDANGNLITKNSNLDAKGGFENIEYYDVNQATGEREGVYYNRDNDSKDNAPLAAKTGETIVLKDGRTVEGIDNFTTYVRNEHKQVIQENFNLDAKGAFDRVYYYDLDVNGNRVGEYQNLDNDTTKTLAGESQITGTTHQLADGREVSGIERYYSREFDSNNRLMKIENNLDAQGQYESATYYERDGYGREVLRYTNADYDMFSNGTPNPTGYSYTITQNGKAVTVNGIDQVVRTTYNEYGSATKVETNNTGEVGEDKFTNVTTNEYNERRQKVADESTIKLENGEIVRGTASLYDYTVYGRLASVTQDRDGIDSFDFKQTYTYNTLGQTVRLDRDILATPEAIDSYVTYSRDIFGNATETYIYANAQGQVESHNTREYDAYGKVSKEMVYNPNGDVIRVNYFEYNERGFVSKQTTDMNNNGLFDGNDSITQTFRRGDDGQIVYQIISPHGKADRKIWYSYDEFNRTSGVHYDDNMNDQIDGTELVTKQSFIGTSTRTNIVETYTGTEFTSLRKLHYSDSGSTLGNIYADKDKVYHTITYNGSGSTPRSSVEDYTESRYDALWNEVGGSIKTINLSNANANTEITLDNNVIAKLTGSELVVNGDATDTINLKDSAEFTKTGEVTRGKQVFEQYTTEVEGTTYTVLIDTDVSVNML